MGRPRKALRAIGKPLSGPGKPLRGRGSRYRGRQRQGRRRWLGAPRRARGDANRRRGSARSAALNPQHHAKNAGTLNSRRKPASTADVSRQAANGPSSGRPSLIDRASCFARHLNSTGGHCSFVSSVKQVACGLPFRPHALALAEPSMKLGRRKNGASVSAPLFAIGKNSDDQRPQHEDDYDPSVTGRCRCRPRLDVLPSTICALA